MLRVILIGMGPIGLACAQAIRLDRNLELLGLVDVDPAKQGKSVEQLSQESRAPGVPGPSGTGPSPGAGGGPGPVVVRSLEEALNGRSADVALLTTSSDFAAVAPTLRDLLARGLAVVSSCEQMAWPWYRHAALAEQIDQAARTAGRAVLGTGVNPGFVMDTLAVVLATMVRRVSGVRCERRVDAALRRQPLQAKVGATMKPERFRELAAQEKIGHAGIAESVALLAAGLGRKVAPGSVEVTLDPVLAERATPSALGLIEPGNVTGIHNVARWAGDGLRIELDLTMAVGLADPRDVVTLDGPVPLKLKIPGGVPGDSATVAALVNHIRTVHKAAPGLRTMLDLPPAGCVGRDL